MKVMTNYFCRKHKGMNSAEHTKRCKVQFVLRMQLHKYIQVEEYEEMEVDSSGNSDWRRNLRLMNVFIAKTRWDIIVEANIVEAKDLNEIVAITGAPLKQPNSTQDSSVWKEIHP
jgi:hypothetical protein